MQLKKLITGGLFLVLASIGYGETYTLTTENYPPFNMSTRKHNSERDAKFITGISTEIVQELFRRAELNYTLTLYPWKRAYRLALENPYHGVFSTARTPAREKLFKWVGPLVDNNYVFLAKKSRNITINKLEDAKPYLIGGYQGSALTLFLKELKFKMSTPIQDRFNAKKLDKGKIDLWATGQLLGPYFAKQEGVSGFETVFVIKKTTLSLALNSQVPEKIIKRLNEILLQMRQDGVIETIHQRYQ